MNWENLTSDEFAEARKQCDGVCILSPGVLERHGSHLPLGTDVLTGWKLANLAAERVPVMVFPQFCLGQIPEAAHQPGTVAISLDLMIQVVDQICMEIHRNGFSKILFLNPHGGNNFWPFFLARQLEKRRDYVVYHYFPGSDEHASSIIKEVLQAADGRSGHAGGLETATSLYLFPELCKLAAAMPESAGMARMDLLNHFKGSKVSTPIDWFSRFPHHLAGYHGKVTSADGQKIVEAMVDDLVAVLEKIKSDQLTPDLMRQFYDLAKR